MLLNKLWNKVKTPILRSQASLRSSQSSFGISQSMANMQALSSRCFSSSSAGEEEEEAEVMEYDVLIVGGGPAGKSKSALTLLFSRLENHITI